MIVSRLLPKKFSSRLFLVTLVAGLVPVVIFAVLIDIYGNRMEREIVRTIEKGYEQDISRSAAMLRKIGEASVYGKVRDIAEQLDTVIQSVPWMTLSDLQHDAKFREVAVQTIGMTGHTFVFEPGSGMVRFHRDLRAENKRLSEGFRNLPELEAIMERSLKETGPASGYYRLRAGDGNIMKRFIYIIPLRSATADQARLSVAATVNEDDFLNPIKQTEAEHRETEQFLLRACKNVIEAFKQVGLIWMGLGILTVSVIASVMGIYLSRAVTRLREATARVKRGDLATPAKPCGSGEVATLIEDFNTMVNRLAETTVSKELLQESEARLREANKELLREIAERERTEEALADEKERLTVTLRSIGDGVIAADGEGRIVLMNDAAEELTGWSQDQAAGQRLSAVFRPVIEAPHSRDALEEALHAGQKGARGPLHQKVLAARDGTVRIIAETRSPIHDRAGNTLGTIIVFRDITLEKRMEEELLKARKLESLGVLAGGIAHDFNNLLAVILGNISFGKMFLSGKDKVSDRLAEAEEACMRGKDLTYKLLAFAHKGEPLRRPVAPAPLIMDCVQSSLRGSRLSLSFSFGEDLPAVKVDEGQFRQVLERIAKNAEEAMGGGGVLEVGARSVTLGPDNSLALKEGEYVHIYLRDEGPGIDSRDLERIFDPYFTSKQMGQERGTGLSLSICYSIVKEHGGSITAESEPGQGTTFHIYVPAASLMPVAAVPAAPKDGGEGEKGPMVKGRLLFMDDDRGVREVMVEMLLQLGYEVQFAREGIEAIERYREAARRGRPFDVVIADLTVNEGMGGKELIKKLHTIDPRVRAIISSGYSSDPVLLDFKEHGFSGFVAKPYKIEELLSVLDTVMREDRQ